MKKKASELEKGEQIKILDKVWKVVAIETSDIGKQGSKKVRLELSSNGEKMAIIRPSEYPFETV
jgi:translation elongation factor P/translation initiation factor 5A